MEGKNAVFQKLKPPCVALSQATLTFNGPRGNGERVVESLEALRHILSSVVHPSSKLDAKLAEYAFFPISQVLKASKKAPIRALELSLQCITILIDHGWRHNIPAQLAAQIVILCTLLAEKEPKGLASAESTPELRSSAFWCLYALFSVVLPQSDAQAQLTSESNIPHLGQTISIILDGIYDGSSVEVQMPAAHALESLILKVLDAEIQASFLPGIVSRLTRILTPQTKLRRNHKVLIKCLDTLSSLLRNTLGDSQGAVRGEEDLANPVSSGKATSPSNGEWQEQAAIQIKPALSNILKLSSHSRSDVRDALARLCSMMLQGCRQTLANCSYMVLESLTAISASATEEGAVTDLEVLVATDFSIADLLQTILYDWLRSLVTTMQGSDEQAKVSKLQQIGIGYEILIKGGADTTTLDHVLASTLRDSVVVALSISSTEQQTAALTSPIQSMALEMSSVEKGMKEFKSPLVKYRSQEDVMRLTERLANMISSSSSSENFVADLARSLRQSQGEVLLASFWLLLTTVQNTNRLHNGITDLLDIEDHHQTALNGYLEEMYSFSLSILSDSSGEQHDPRLQAMAIRSIALRAQTAGRDFRYELVDALYPVLHVLATPDAMLQQDSMTALNILASACGYASVQALIVENVDYLTNAVALKLNAFDVSPQAPQVLLMMVRLAGPSLLPYLEDTIESIFAALEDYHGYPLLVELLFKVLGVIAEEGAKAPQLTITEASQTHLIVRERWQPTTMHGLAALLKASAKEIAVEENEYAVPNETHPERPWKSIEETEDGDTPVDDPDPEPPAPRTYNLLFKITELTQHFLSSGSPSLRTSLLSLIRTTVPAIARHENSFLPLINTLWPEVVSRLDDSEPYIVATALDIVRVLCEYAGDFMRSRIVQLWARLVELHHAAAKDIGRLSLPRSTDSTEVSRQKTSLMLSERRGNHAVNRKEATQADYGDTTNRLLLTALVACVTTIIRNVPMPPDLFDEALAMIGPALGREDVGAGFQKENEDAVWLARLRGGTTARPRMPVVTENFHWQFAAVPG